MTREELQSRLGISNLDPRAVLVAAVGEDRVRCLPSETIDMLARRLIAAGTAGEPGDTTDYDRTLQSVLTGLYPCPIDSGMDTGATGAVTSSGLVKTLAIGAAGVAAVAGLVWWAFSGSE